MKRTSINPTHWGLAFLMDQGEVVEGATRTLRCSGQVSLHDDPEAENGFAVTHPGDMRAQIQDALGHLDALLESAGMTRANIVNLRFYATDVDAYLANYDLYAEWIGPAGIRPPQTVLGVAQLAVTGLMIEIEMEAAA
jgi:enamine deaminase RidA (YjgF/YER057c/UK114 family)